MFTTSCRTTASPPKKIGCRSDHAGCRELMHAYAVNNVAIFTHMFTRYLIFFYNFPMQPVEKKNVQESVVYERHNNFSTSVE